MGMLMRGVENGIVEFDGSIGYTMVGFDPRWSVERDALVW